MKDIIIIHPILFQMTADLSSSLEMHLSKGFHASVKTAPPINETLPLKLFDKNREQWKSTNILLWLLDRTKPDRSEKY
jgi:hypothetical protein